MRRICAVLAALAFLVSASNAGATVFKFNYAGEAVTGSGTLTANLIAPGEYQVVSGTDFVVGGVINGALSLLANAHSPDAASSPSAYFIYDDLLFYNLNPVINNNGLLFEDAAGHEVNLFSNGPDNYVHYDNTGFNQSVSFTLTEVPEPASITILVIALLGVGYVRQHRSRLLL